MFVNVEWSHGARLLYSTFNGLALQQLKSQSWDNLKCQFLTLYVAVYLLISIINCHKYHSNVSFLSCISCRGGSTFSVASTSNCNYCLIPTDGYSAHCGHSSFDTVDEVSQFVTCKIFEKHLIKMFYTQLWCQHSHMHSESVLYRVHVVATKQQPPDTL